MSRYTLGWSAAPLLCLAGCVPVAYDYVHLQAPAENVTYLPLTCRQYGPLAILQYDMGGLQYELSLTDEGRKGMTVWLEVRAPVNSAVSLPEPTLDIFDAKNQKVATAALQPKGTERAVDGLLTSLWEPRKYWARYRFALVPLPQLPDRGSARIPAFRLNAATVPAHNITFDRRLFVGTIPLDC